MADPDTVAAANKQTVKSASSASTASTNTTGDANASATANQPNGSAQQPDPTKPADPNPELSVGGNNPNQGSQGGSEGNVTGTVGQTVNATSIRHPSEGVGYSPKPADNTGDADTNGIEYEQTVQRLAPLDTLHDAAHALGATVVNIPPGSRPMMVDPATGLALNPPQMPQAKPAETEPTEA